MEQSTGSSLDNAKRLAYEAEAQVRLASGKPAKDQVILLHAAQAYAAIAHVWATLHETERD